MHTKILGFSLWMGLTLLMGANYSFAGISPPNVAPPLTAPQFIQLDSSATLRLPTQNAAFIEKNRSRSELALFIEFKDYGFTTLKLGVPVVGLTYRIHQQNAPALWYLKVFTSFGESTMADDWSIWESTDSGNHVEFSQLSLFGLGGGARIMGKDNWFSDIGANVLFFHNSQTNSGLYGYEVVAKLGRIVQLSPQFAITPTVGISLIDIMLGNINGTTARLNGPILGVDYQVGLEATLIL